MRKGRSGHSLEAQRKDIMTSRTTSPSLVESCVCLIGKTGMLISGHRQRLVLACVWLQCLLQTPSSNPNPSPTLASATGVCDLGLRLPDVHPSLIIYLNQDAARRAASQQQQSEDSMVDLMGPVSSSNTPSRSVNMQGANGSNERP